MENIFNIGLRVGEEKPSSNAPYQSASLEAWVTPMDILHYCTFFQEAHTLTSLNADQQDTKR